MDKRPTNRTTSSTQEPTHLDLAEYQAEWARIHENTVRQLEQLKANGQSGKGSGAGSQRSPSDQSPS
ncbi:hypothetical protein ANOM_000795 [Aspergillus nomiae NRRL 13137]|uniref:Uncharacterized protein n=1 Tax=Aspergillus nomiae NRRL (strain ATCC 15546 / NRRL 13137 / CBS 260.88 / M93) TaxID=1509407 RepID=A0A0L1JI42_ASPN3|nr:uncharacterized protein ANOM_000795 [Aspergillus nomiae NRRL 13137]KNG91068.1 hypothetical protein ANOM_000795 [Aspergillus nomiae NRRL 13137]